MLLRLHRQVGDDGVIDGVITFVSFGFGSTGECLGGVNAVEVPRPLLFPAFLLHANEGRYADCHQPKSKHCHELGDCEGEICPAG